MPESNSDERELAKFSELAHRWWDPLSEFRPLHEINPLRLHWINEAVQLKGKTVLDVGCGGGILSESMATQGAIVTGIDLSEKALSVARLHLYESQQSVSYQLKSVEILAQEMPASFDAITCMEMLEHVPDPSSVINACAQLVKPGGHVFFSTLSRNAAAYFLAIVGAEYILNMLPRGTHEYGKFIKPSELARFSRNAGLNPVEVIGLQYNPLTQIYTLDSNTNVNYLMHTQKL